MILALPGEQVKILVILLYLVSVLDMMGHGIPFIHTYQHPNSTGLSLLAGRLQSQVVYLFQVARSYLETDCIDRSATRSTTVFFQEQAPWFRMFGTPQRPR